MLNRLSVSNFAIIDELNLTFDKGLTIITGETGAGKSILLGALRLILGERADLKQLNKETEKCVIEAVFDLSKLRLQTFFEENELDYDVETIIRRELLPSGKSRAFINDTPVTLNNLQALGEKLIDIHSQFNTQNLIDSDFQLEMMDAFAGQLEVVKNYQTFYNQRNKKITELKDLKEKLNQKGLESDYKKFLFEELNSAQLKENELSELETEQKELQHIEVIQQYLSETESRINTPEFGLLSQLGQSSNQLQKITEYGKELEEFYQRIESVRIELNDLNTEISSKLQNLESNPEKLNEINERIDLIQNLLHKHRVQSVEELIIIQNQLENEEANFKELELKIEDSEIEIKKIEQQLFELGNEISESRRNVIPKLETEFLESLSKLGMENSSLKIDLTKEKQLGTKGIDKIEFLFSANKGAQMQVLGKAISGGERSRLMMAVKKCLAGKLELPTLILDEIDTGVSGKVANEMGLMMQEMATNLQLISITHLPQVAAKANQHFKVKKKTDSNKTFTEVICLSREEQIQELAELISGSNVTEAALIQAKELL